MSKILNGIPENLLDESEEAFLSNQIQNEDNKREDSMNKLALHNMREAVPYATRCCRAKLLESEIFSLSYAALMKAARNFKPQGIRFFAYAKVYIRGEISRVWKTKDNVRNSSLHETDVETNPGTRIGVIDADELEIIVELQKPLEPDFIEPDFAGIDLRERWAVVKPLIQVALNERERTVVRLYYESGFSFEQIGDMLVPSVSRAAVQSTHCRALNKIRAALTRAKRTV